MTRRQSSSAAARGADRKPARVVQPHARQTLWTLRRLAEPPVTAVLLSYDHGVELHLYCGSALRRQLCFLRELPPVKYAERLRGKLEARGYKEGRRDRRVERWLTSRSAKSPSTGE